MDKDRIFQDRGKRARGCTWASALRSLSRCVAPAHGRASERFLQSSLTLVGQTASHPSAVNRQLEEPLVHKHPRGVAVRQQVARAVELEIRPRTLARILRSHRQGSEELSQRLDEKGHRVYGGTAQRL